MKCIWGLLLAAASALAADFTTGQAARLVIGQETFTSQLATASDSILGGVSGLAYAGDTLFVADSNRVGAEPFNHRVLLFKNLSSMLPPPSARLDYSRKCPVCVGNASVVLGQPDFATTDETINATQSDLRLPTAVASDGVHVVVADTNHNRVLIWNRIPTTSNQAADVVVGQPDFTHSSIPGNQPNAKSMRGPQGVWIQNGKLYVADTQNNRVLIYNQIPTSNGVAADVVLGQPDLNTFAEPDLTQQKTGATASGLLNPVAVTSDGVRLFVTDLGYNRILIWNTIPSKNAAPADVVIGQPDFTSATANNAFTVDTTNNNKESPVLCTTPVKNGNDTNGNPTYPATCNATVSFPRFALSDGQRLFVADGGNDRLLVFNQIPTTSGVSADYIIGQIGGDVNQASDAADSLRTPMSLAWDGTNLYVSDAYNRRITVYSIGENNIPYTGVRNAASQEIIAVGGVTFGGTITANDTVTVTISKTDSNTGSQISTKDYKYTVKSGDTLGDVLHGMVKLINADAGDPFVLAYPDDALVEMVLVSRSPGTDGNFVSYSTALSDKATLLVSVLGTSLTGGGDAAKVGPGTIVSISAATDKILSYGTGSADPTKTLPTTLAGTEVYFNGVRAPLLYVSPTQINAQIPWEFNDTTSINAFVRSVRSDGLVLVTTPVAVTIVPENPGIFATGTDTPPAAVAYHASSQALGVISVDGVPVAGEVDTVKIEDRSYSYTAVTNDTAQTVRDQLVSLISQDPKVTAESDSAFPTTFTTGRIMIRARVQGPDGNGIAFSGTVTLPSGSTASGLTLTAIGGTTCCANFANAPINDDNPALPGEMIIVLATGLGLPTVADAQDLITTGVPYPPGSPNTVPVEFVSSLAGKETANVLFARLLPGTIGVYEVWLQLAGDLPADPRTQLTIAQSIYVSNIVTIPVAAP